LRKRVRLPDQAEQCVMPKPGQNHVII